MKISALIKKLGGKTLGLLTIWARQNLQLQTSSKSGWRALVQVMLPLVHVDLKWSEGSGRSAFMGSVYPVLYWPVVRAQNLCGCQILCARPDFHYFSLKIQNPISASKCPITAPKIRTWSQLLSKFSCNTHKLLNGGRPWFWPRSPETGHNPYGVWGGGRK